ncbi:hypothetical protein B9T25_10210 [Acinetobacter sp. ANC 4470]|uniref:hypothetical protein n=1 Tax=Acinetobacter sp. ANC 4470 TaxID=1977881 RepID=UPI000A33B350|nr:hypothetical protein [Acinetobacter sp. ANC 4470]OTG66173.1 hypothetical protein B9T25_10210 [Acinetobacter sp. ANC 4470]
MTDLVYKGFKENGDAFSVATLIYARLRRVAGRIIDVMYLVQNKDYAQYVVELAQAENDAELGRHAARLNALIIAEREPSFAVIQEEIAKIVQNEVEVTEDEIYKAQVSHHYIGALR